MGKTSSGSSSKVDQNQGKDAPIEEASSNRPVISNLDDAAATSSRPRKPTRPLTAYHLFFQLEREYILQTTQCVGASNNPEEEDTRLIGKQIDPIMPYRYRYIHLSPHWYASGSGKRTGKATTKRKHRKTHGKIGFLDLSKRIASRWAILEETDHATKMYVCAIAARELEGYRKEANKFKEISVSALVAEPSDFLRLEGLRASVESMDRLETNLKPINTSCKTANSKREGGLCALVGPVSPKTYTNSSDAKNIVAIKNCHPMRHGISNSVTPHENMRRSTASLSPEHSLPPLPSWLKPESSMLSAPVESIIPCTTRNVTTSTSSATTWERDNVAAKESDSFGEFSFHPIPSSFWKTYKKRSKQGGRLRTSRIGDVSQEGSKMTSSLGPNGASTWRLKPALYGYRPTIQQHGNHFSSGLLEHAPHGYSRREAVLPNTQNHGHRASSRIVEHAPYGYSRREAVLPNTQNYSRREARLPTTQRHRGHRVPSGDNTQDRKFTGSIHSNQKNIHHSVDFKNGMDSFASSPLSSKRKDRRSEGMNGRGYDYGFSIDPVPMSYNPAESSHSSPGLKEGGLKSLGGIAGSIAAITSDDAMGLMKALSDDEWQS